MVGRVAGCTVIAFFTNLQSLFHGNEQAYIPLAKSPGETGKLEVIISFRAVNNSWRYHYAENRLFYMVHKQ